MPKNYTGCSLLTETQLASNWTAAFWILTGLWLDMSGSILHLCLLLALGMALAGGRKKTTLSDLVGDEEDDNDHSQSPWVSDTMANCLRPGWWKEPGLDFISKSWELSVTPMQNKHWIHFAFVALNSYPTPRLDTSNSESIFEAQVSLNVNGNMACTGYFFGHGHLATLRKGSIFHHWNRQVHGKE